AWRARGARTAIPAALRYALAVSRRTPVAFSISRRLQPSLPSAITWLYLSWLKTFTSSADHTGPTTRNALELLLRLAGFQVSTTGRIWVSTEGATQQRSPHAQCQLRVRRCRRRPGHGAHQRLGR